MGGRSMVGQPVIGFGCQASRALMGVRKIRSRSLKGDGGASEPEVVEPSCQEKPLSVESRVPVPQTDTGRRVEYTKANGRTLVKELGKITP
jgi:hypothetical protein